MVVGVTSGRWPVAGGRGAGAKAQKWDRCDASLKSFAHLAVAARNGCSWCLDFGYVQAFNEHLDLRKGGGAALARVGRVHTAAYTIRNPGKLARVGEQTALSR